MNIVLLQSKVSEEEIQLLINEFPQFIFLAPLELSYRNLGLEEWEKIEVIYGNRLTAKEFYKAHQLRWIHSAIPHLNPLCLKELEKEGRVIVTSTKEENIFQIGEYVEAGVLALAKNLFHWEEADLHPMVLWDSKRRETMWTLQNRTFVQVGLGRVGSEIARRFKQLEMRVWGIQEHKTFHPSCHKTFSYQELHSLLPTADVVCLALPRGEQRESWFKKEELELMKEDSILMIIGSKNFVDEEALAVVAETGKFRGIFLDAYYQMPVPPNSRLWSIPNMIITPEVAPRPKKDTREAFKLFRYNMRQYLHGNFTDMRNVVNLKPPKP